MNEAEWEDGSAEIVADLTSYYVKTELPLVTLVNQLVQRCEI